MSEENKNKSQKVRYPIGLKLILLFSLLVIAVLGFSTAMVSTLVRQDEQIKAEETNHTINSRTAISVQDTFLNIKNNVISILNYANASNVNENFESLFSEFFENNDDLIFIHSSKTGLLFNPSFLINRPDATDKIQSFMKNSIIKNSDLKKGSLLKNISDVIGLPSLCMHFAETNNEITTVGMLTTSLTETMSTGSFNTTFLINMNGDLLVHPDFEKVKSKENIAKLDIVKYVADAQIDNGQSVFANENGEKTFYAFHKLDFADLVVVTSEAQSLVFEELNRTTYRSVLISLAILFLSIIIIRFFSKKLTSPIHTLVEASRRIESGEFILDIKPASRDEVGLLTSSFVQMGTGLAERERLRTSFSKFTNKTIAEKAMKGELTLGGENRTATIFFSDIRSFTAISEKLEPAEVVEFLNAYMTKMVECVNKYNGVVDKYIGDAIMAVWGAPESAGTPADDAWNCVRAALMMRKVLYEFNKDRGTEKKPILKIGCGINTGEVVAGQIGSVERMEYTVIGDAVNFASRTEALNKPFATDILITENTYNLIKEKIIVEEMPSVTVKGKEKSVKMFAVINVVGASHPVNITELRTILKVQAPDLAKVNTNEEEKKYKIGE